MKERRFERIAIRLRRDLFGDILSESEYRAVLTAGRETWHFTRLLQEGQERFRGEGTVYVLSYMKEGDKRNSYRRPAALVVLDPAVRFDDAGIKYRLTEVRESDVAKLFEALRGMLELAKDAISGHEMIEMNADLELAETEVRNALTENGRVETPIASVVPCPEKMDVDGDVIHQKSKPLTERGQHHMRAVVDTDRFLDFCEGAAKSGSEVLVRATHDGKLRVSARINDKRVYLRLDRIRVASSLEADLDVVLDPILMADEVAERGPNGYVIRFSFAAIDVFDNGVACMSRAPDFHEILGLKPEDSIH